MRHVLLSCLPALLFFRTFPSFAFGFRLAPLFWRPICSVNRCKFTIAPVFTRVTSPISVSLTGDEAELGYDDGTEGMGAAHDGLFPLYHAFLEAVESNRWQEASQQAQALKQSGYFRLDQYTSRILLDVAVKNDQVNQASQLLEELGKMGTKPDHVMAEIVSLAPRSTWGSILDNFQKQSETTDAPAALPRLPGTFQLMYATALQGKMKKTTSSGTFWRVMKRYRCFDLPTCKLALQALLMTSSFEDALTLTQDMRREGIAPDIHACVLFLKVFQRLGLWKEAFEVIKYMRAKKFAIQPIHINLLLLACNAAGAWEESLMVLAAVKDSALIDEIHYATVAKALLEARQEGRLRPLMKEWNDRFGSLDIDIANSVLFSASRDGNWKGGKLFFDEIVKLGAKPDVKSYTALIKACSRRPKTANRDSCDVALGLYHDMKVQGVDRNLLTYAAIFEALSVGGLWEEVLNVFENLSADGLVPDIITYTQVCGACARAGRWKEALKLLTDCEEKRGLIPDAYCYGVVIDACGEASRFEEAMDLLSDMKEHGVRPTIFCYTGAVKACIDSRQWKAALALLEEAKCNGIRPDYILYRTVIKACWRASEWNSLLQVHEEMRTSLGSMGDSFTYHLCIDSLSKAGQVERASLLIDEMLRAGITPYQTTLTSYLSALYSLGKEKKVWEELERISTPPHPSKVYAGLIHVAAKEQKWRNVLEIIEKMKKGGVRLERFHAIAWVRALAEVKMWDLTEGAMKEMEALGLEVSTKTYGMLLSVCSKQIKPNTAMELLKRMKESRLKADASCYRHAMDANAQAGRTKEVWVLYKEMGDTGVEPDLMTYAILLELCSRQEDCERACIVMDEIKGRGLIPNVLCYGCALQACSDPPSSMSSSPPIKEWRSALNLHSYTSEVAVTRSWAQALRLFEEMRTNGIEPNIDSYNVLLTCCYRSHKVQEAIDLLGSMRIKSTTPKKMEGRREEVNFSTVSVVPNALTYLVLLNIVCRAGDVKRSKDFLDALLRLAQEGGGILMLEGGNVLMEEVGEEACRACLESIPILLSWGIKVGSFVKYLEASKPMLADIWEEAREMVLNEKVQTVAKSGGGGGGGKKKTKTPTALKATKS